MLSGRGKFQLIDVAGIESEVEKAAHENRYADLQGLMRDRDREEYEAPNQVIHYVSGWMFQYIFNGVPGINSYYANAIGRALSFVYVNNYTANSPAYSTDEFNAYYRFYRDSTNFDLPWKISGTGYYRSVKGCNSSNNNVATDICEAPKCWSETYSTGKRAIYRSMKWIWLPTELNSTDINSMSMVTTQDAYWSAPSTENYCREFSRIRIKDSNDNMITISKNASKVLIFEYTFRLMSL
jgi:hypothetical protein